MVQRGSFPLKPMGAVRIRHSIREFATQPVILWILLGGKPKWLPLNFGFNDVMRTAPIDEYDHAAFSCELTHSRLLMIIEIVPIMF